MPAAALISAPLRLLRARDPDRNQAGDRARGAVHRQTAPRRRSHLSRRRPLRRTKSAELRAASLRSADRDPNRLGLAPDGASPQAGTTFAPVQAFVACGQAVATSFSRIECRREAANRLVINSVLARMAQMAWPRSAIKPLGQSFITASGSRRAHIFLAVGQRRLEHYASAHETRKRARKIRRAGLPSPSAQPPYSSGLRKGAVQL